MPTLDELKAKKWAKFRRAAVAFANDYGPLVAANTGNEEAMDKVAMRLVQYLRRENLDVN